MSYKKLPQHLILLVLVIVSLALTIFLSWTSLVQAQHQPTDSQLIRFITPDEQPLSPIRRREEIRGYAAQFCANDDQEKPFLTAVIPETGLGLTLAEFPQFFIYIPDFSWNSGTHELKGELVVLEQDDEVLSETVFSITNMSGVVSFRLPATAPPLSIGKNYHWYFAIFCDEELENTRFVEGWVKRISLDSSFTHLLEKASQIQRVALYAEHGIWHETLATLLELRRDQPDDATVAAAWGEVLKAVKLEPLTQAPLVECCVMNGT